MLFSNPIDIIKAFDNASFYNALEKIEKIRSKYYLVGYIKYEAKEIFLKKEINDKYPILYFEVFENYQIYNKQQPKECFIFIKDLLNKDIYLKNIQKIKNLIEEGITYEVNYTYPSEIYTNKTEYELFLHLLNEQETRYSAFIRNEYETILSFSPELFFEINNNKILTKPMKGTIRRGSTKEEDERNKQFLQNDIKNRSENIMIVDLIRNDLSKIAETGSIKANKLFEIEQHKTLFQMTSEVSAKLKEDIRLYDILEALFPSGSITGAPKISTMKIIDTIEKYKREVYTGAIGIITPDKIEFSVPIRILQKKNNEISYKYAAGGAIVWDSDANNEYEESILKRKFLLTDKDFEIIETMKSENGIIFLFEEHIKRLKNSCCFFGFKFPENIEFFKPEKDGIIRLTVSKTGEYNIEYKAYNPIISNNKVKLAKTNTFSGNILLYHKTTIREHYQKTAVKIQNGEIFDEIYFNEKGELTEGSRTNIVIEKDGNLYTPPIDCGLLDGTLRNHLLKQNKIIEKILYPDDLKTADAVYCINSIRGIVRVKLI